MRDLSVPAASLGSIISSTLFYVWSCSHFVCSSRLKDALVMEEAIVTAISVQFTLGSTYSAIQIVRGFEAFVGSHSSINDAIQYWSNPAKPVDMTVFLFASGVFSYVTDGLSARIFIFKGSPVFPLIAWILSLCTQLFSSAFIAWKIYSVQLDSVSIITESATRLDSILYIVIESGAVYTIMLILILVIEGLNLQTSGVIMAATVHLCGIIPCITVARVGMTRWMADYKSIKRGSEHVSAMVFTKSEKTQGRRSNHSSSMDVNEDREVENLA
ncbi:hypothetical protein BDQ12DRAFT_717018 [Crucibulum laeve]|uniref:Uncharacterized protein n=1 Tax=Crucibulum laeve TaxID=68775 RepID=A0A5C3LFB8_9AGAR|nr:hypothetical protein BDQ12DRAFT_717018 [Crucibulum laeve]